MSGRIRFPDGSPGPGHGALANWFGSLELALARDVLCAGVVTQPRRILPNSTYMATRRTTQQQFWLRPDATTNNDTIYCIAVAALRHQIQVIDFNVLSNHLHQVFRASLANAPEYLRDVHGLIAKVMNARLGRWENLWSSAKPSLVELANEEDLIDKIVYVASNAVRHGLVERIEEWPGARGFHALLSGKPLKATKPKSFFSSKNKKLPDKVKLHLRIPPELGDHKTIMKAVIPRVSAAVRYFGHQRELTGIPVLGRARILRQPRAAAPSTPPERRGLNPRIGAKELETRLAAIQTKREFQKEYRLALLAYRAGAPISFPVGTYWLARHLGVGVKPIEKLS